MSYDPHILEVFKKESNKCITNVNNLLLKAEKEGGSSELYKTIKGEVHTLKGDARMLGFESISLAAHKLEDLFALLEKEKEKGDSELFKNVFKVLDLIEDAVKRIPEEMIDIDVSPYLSKQGKTVSRDRTEIKTEITKEKEEKKTVPSATAVSSEKKESKEKKTEILNINMKKIDNLIGISSVFPRYFNRFSYVLGKLNDMRKEVEQKYKDHNLLNDFDAILRDFSHELAFYDLTAKQFQDKITKLKLVPLSSIFDLFPRLVRDVAQNTKKKVNFIIEGSDVELDMGVVEKLKSILIHILQNAVDHGCETPAERKEKGKPEEGRITLKAFNKGDNVIIEISDDGYGLDVERIRHKAIEKGILKKEKAMELPDDQIIPILFESGFSTKDVSVYSGRGIGMDVVATTVKEMNGEITVKTVRDKGTIFSISLPLISSYIPITVFALGDYLYGIPSAYIKTAMRVKADEVFDTGKRWKVIKIDNMEISLVDLNVFFKLGKPGDEKSKNIIVAVYQDEITGLIVNEVLMEMKMLIRKTSGMADKFNVIIGAVLSGKERAIPVLNVLSLFKLLKNGKGALTKIKKNTDYLKEFGAHKILLVENSIVTRDLEKKILLKQNLIIFEAGNGKEALQFLEEQEIDMIITDIEMPVMNGIELITKMKEKEELKNIPVVVISSYKTYSDKVEAMGVKYFIDKSEFSEEILIKTIKAENLL
ncbi:MAG: response regulator [Spirochaetales bacterium]|nr:response regulator [Spirochaetales bacterium]